MKINRGTQLLVHHIYKDSSNKELLVSKSGSLPFVKMVAAFAIRRYTLGYAVTCETALDIFPPILSQYSGINGT